MFINSRLGRSQGGRETWAHTFLPALARDRNIEIVVFGIQDVESTDPHSESMAARIEGCPNISLRLFPVRRGRIPFFIQMWRAVRFDLRQSSTRRPDWVLALGVYEFLMTALTSYAEIRRAVWMRSIFVNEKASRIPSLLRSLARVIEIRVLRRANLILANGEDIAAYYRSHGLQVDVIENGVDFERWHRGWRRIGKRVSVAFIGRLTPVKGIVEFVKCASVIMQGELGARFEFHVVGSGPFASDPLFLERKRFLIVHGEIQNDQLPAFLEHVDVCVALTLSSGGAGISNALLEQMAAGKVIVAWDNPIFRQILDDDCAYLVPEGDYAALAHTLFSIADAPLVAEQKANAAARAAGDRDVEVKVAQFKELLAAAAQEPAH